MKKTYTNKEAEAIEFLKSIGYQFNPKERHFLYNAVNTTKSTIRVNGEDKPSSVVISVLLKLNYFDFLYAVQKYKQNTTKVNNHGAYILTLLYNAKAQNEADVTNQVQHDLYGSGD